MISCLFDVLLVDRCDGAEVSTIVDRYLCFHRIAMLRILYRTVILLELCGWLIGRHLPNAVADALSSVPFDASKTKVAVIGTTGRLGYETVEQLSQQGIATRCLVRPGGGSSEKQTILSNLRTLPGVELIPGDVNDEQSLAHLIEGTTTCFALHGATAPKPFVKAFFPFWYKETDPQHPKQINYVGIQKLLDCMKDSPTCKHLVRITGKGETPWSIFSILINTLGGIAKGWNYEGEQLIRNQTGIKYTIVRPGIMKSSLPEDSDIVQLAVRDNGQDMKVTAVSYSQIANLLIQILGAPNCHRSTLTAMNVNRTEHASNTDPLAHVQPDTRDFPVTLIDEHKKAARVGGLTMLAVITWTIYSILTWLVPLISSVVLR
jgi:NAD(P)H-binding